MTANIISEAQSTAIIKIAEETGVFVNDGGWMKSLLAIALEDRDNYHPRSIAGIDGLWFLYRSGEQQEALVSLFNPTTGRVVYAAVLPLPNTELDASIFAEANARIKAVLAA